MKGKRNGRREVGREGELGGGMRESRVRERDGGRDEGRCTQPRERSQDNGTTRMYFLITPAGLGWVRHLVLLP